MNSLDRDLAFVLSDFDSTELRIGTVTLCGHLTEMDVISDDAYGDVRTRLTTIRVARAALIGVDGTTITRPGDTVMLAGVTHTVSEVLVGDPREVDTLGHDGREAVIRLVRA